MSPQYLTKDSELVIYHSDGLKLWCKTISTKPVVARLLCQIVILKLIQASDMLPLL